MRSLAIIALLLGTSCARTRVETSIRAEHIGTKYARVTGYFATRAAAPGGRHTEDTPGDIRHEVIRDEATLVKFEPDETCIAVVVRTESGHDEPFEQLSPMCELDGDAEARAVVEDETVSVFDYTYAGALEVAHVEGATAEAYLGLSISAPADRVFRVIERRGTLCCPRGGGSHVALDLTHPYWDVADYNYHLVFDWHVSAR